MTTSPTPGCFITLEGIDGAGKSTHVAWLTRCLEILGRSVVATREPGGTPFGEKLREILLGQPTSPDTAALLMFAARREHLEQVIRPALARGEWVLCDRFTDATFAYQGGGHGVAADRIHELESWIQGATVPDLTFLFDVPAGVSRERLMKAKADGRSLDRFEREEQAFFERVRAAYHQRAAADPARFRIVDSTQPVEAVRALLSEHIDRLVAGAR